MKALLVEQIGDAYLDAEKSGKWVDYQAQRRLSTRIDGVLDAAYQSMKNGNFEPAIVAGFEILRRNIKLINHNDDSCGYLGGFLNEAMRLLQDTAEQDLNRSRKGPRTAAGKCRSPAQAAGRSARRWHRPW